jgi:hypothetical protein
VEEIGRTLEALQKIVGGRIEMLDNPDFSEGLQIVCDEENKLVNDPQPNVYWGDYDAVCGDILFVGIDGEGETVSLTPKQIDEAKKWIATNDASPVNKNQNNNNNVKEDKDMGAKNNVDNDTRYGTDKQSQSPQGESKPRPTPEEYVRLADAEYLRAMREGRYAEIVDGIADLGYGVRNVMLIKRQFPAATKTRGLHAWNYYGRSVLEGSKSIKILAVSDNAGDADGEKSYRFSSVFDISQTKSASKGREFSGNTCTPEVLDKYCEGIKRAIAQQAREYTFTEGEKAGVDFENKTVTVQQGLSREDTLKAMIYGTARVRTEGKARSEGAEISQTRALFHQIEETAAAHIVSRRLGLGDYPLKAVDFSQYDDEGLMRVSTNLHYVKMGAQRITDAVERYLSEAQSSDALRAANAAAANAPVARPQPAFRKQSAAEAT